MEFKRPQDFDIASNNEAIAIVITTKYTTVEVILASALTRLLEEVGDGLPSNYDTHYTYYIGGVGVDDYNTITIELEELGWSIIEIEGD